MYIAVYMYNTTGREEEMNATDYHVEYYIIAKLKV